MLGCRPFAWLLPGTCKPKCNLPRQFLLAMRAKAKVIMTTSTVVALSIQWRIRIPTEVALVQRSMIATTRRSFTVVVTTRMIETVHRVVIVNLWRRRVRTWPTATIGSSGHAGSMCVLAPTSTPLAQVVLRVSAVECTCHRHANALYRLATRPQSGPKR